MALNLVVYEAIHIQGCWENYEEMHITVVHIRKTILLDVKLIHKLEQQDGD